MLALGVTNAWGAEWEKVTVAPADWSGEYLIVYETGKVIFDGSLTSLDQVKKAKSVTINNNAISLDENYSFTIAKSGSNYTVKSKSGYFIGQTSNANGLKSSTSTSYSHTITINNDGTVNLVSSGAYLRYNAASDQLRFRYYKSSSYSGQKAICLYKKVDVPQTVAVTGVSLNKTSLTLTEGDSETLTATVTPADATDKTVTWSTSNANFATVSNGKVTAVAEGSATITVKTKDGNKTATCNVIVNPKPTYTVNWYVNGNKEYTQTDVAGATLTNIPNLEGYECGGKVFVGWTTQSSYENATNAPNDLITNTAGMTIPENGEDYYAVFAETGGLSDENEVLLNFTGGTKNDLTNTEGITASGLGSDYAESNAPYRVKFDGTGDYIQYKNESCPFISQVYFKVKMIGGANTSKITIKTSDDGTNYTERSICEISGNEGAVLNFTENINVSAKYLRLHFTKGSNVGLGPLIIYTKSSSYQNYTTKCVQTYKVTFNANGHGTAPTAQNVEENTKATEPTAPSATGYTFDGWYTDQACSDDKKFNFDTPITEDITLYAKWTAKTYTITFKAGTGTCGTESATATNADGITLPTATPSNVCEEADWTFAGWATSSVEDPTTEPTLLKANDKYQPTSDITDITLYAVYSKTEESGGGTDYQLVTSEPTDWSGTYLIVNTEDAKVWKGSATSDNGAIDVTITSNTIKSDETTDKEIFTIAPMTGGYSIKGASGKYISGTSGDNTTNYGTSAALNTISIDEDNNVKITSNTSVLRQNSSTKSMFRYYKSSTYSTQRPIQLYKKGTGSTITTYSSNPDCTPPTEYTITWWANGEEYRSQTAVEGTAIEVPTTSPDAAVYACDDKVFVGWVDTEIIGSTDTKPTLITDFDKITENKDFFAVFATRSSSEPTAYTAGEVGDFVLAAKNSDKWYALPTNPTINSGKIQGVEIPVTTTNGVEHVTTANALGYTWTIANATNGQTISDGSKYIYHSNGGVDGTNLTYGIGTSFTWKIEKEDAGLTFKAMNGTTVNNRGMLMQGTQYGGYSLTNETTNGYYRISVLPIADAVSYSGYVTTCEKPIYTRVVKPGEYGTICLPYGSSDYTGAEFYEVSSVEYGKGLWLDQLAAGTALAAGKPYIFRAIAEKLAVVYKGEKKDSPVGGVNGLTGTFTAIAANSTLVGHYIIALNQIWVANDKNTLPAYRAYIDKDGVPTTEQPKLAGRRRVCMGENAATGLDNITNGENTTIKVIENGQLIIIRNGEKFNAQGQKL